MIYYIVAAVLIVIISFLIIFFYFKKIKNKEYKLITRTNNISLQDNQPSVMEVQSHDLDFFYNNFNMDDYHILGLSNIDGTINSSYKDAAVKSLEEVIITAIQLKTLKSVFKATADPATLMKLKDGIGSAVMENGKIIAQAGFVNISPAEMAIIIGPQVVFSVLSIVVGQHFMDEISKKLSDISEKLDKILLHFKKEHIAVLESSKKLIHNISKLNYTDGEHIDRLMRIEENVNEIYEYYESELKNLDINNLNTDKWIYKSKMKEMYKKLQEKINDAQFCVKICFYSKELLNLIQLVKFNTYIKMQKADINAINADINAINKANELFEEINNWKSDLFYNEDNPYNKYINLIEESKEKLKQIRQDSTIINFIEYIQSYIDYRFNTNFYKGNKLYNELTKKIEGNKNIELNNHNSIYKQSRIMIEKMKKPKDIILLKDDSGNIISLCKKKE